MTEKRLDTSSSILPSVDHLSQLAKLARFLGVMKQEEVIRMLAMGLPFAQVSAREMFPEWWDAHRIERMERDEDLIDPTTLSAMVYNPKIFESSEEEELMGSSCLFPSLCPPDVRRPHGLNAGDVIISGGGDLNDYLDARIVRVLRSLPGTAVLAGGAVLASLVPSLPEAGDYDIFLVGLDTDEASDAALHEIYRLLLAEEEDQKGAVVTQTGNAVTFVLSELMIDEEIQGEIVVQVILRKYANLAQVLSSFDIGPCKVAAFFSEGVLMTRCAPTWAPCMQRLAFPVDLGRWSTSSVFRTYKYLCKGFEVYVPGASREAMMKIISGNRDAKWNLAALFKIERTVYREMGTVASEWPTRRKVDRHLKGSCQSDYDTRVDFRKSVKYVVRSMLRGGFDLVVGRPMRFVSALMSRRNDTKESPKRQKQEVVVEWSTYRPERAIITPADPNWYLVAPTTPPPEFDVILY